MSSKKNHGYIVGSVLLLFLLLIPRVGSYSQIGEYQSKLDELTTKVTEQKKLRDEVRMKELSILGKLQNIEREAERIKDNISEIDQELNFVREEIERLEGEIDVTEEKLSKRQDLLGERLRAVYKLGQNRTVRILSSAESYADLLRRIRFLLIIAYQDKQLAKEIREDKQHLEAAREVLVEHEAEVVQLRKLMQGERNRLEGELSEQENIYTQVRTERQSYEKVIAEMEAASAELKTLIQRELRKLGEVTDMEPLTFSPPYKNYISGNTVTAPTNGTIVRSFGKQVHPIYGTVTRNDGIDISAPQGQTVHSVMAGQVIFADWFRGYGKLVIIDHGSGYTTLYSHLHDVYVSVGEMVAENQGVGTVGSTGTLGEIILHFEIRKDGSPINPEKWLAGQY